MNNSAMILLAVAGIAALAAWWGVAKDRLNVEFVANPLVLIALIGTVLAVDVDDSVTRGILIAAMGASLLGDVVLMNPDAGFEIGLFAFLLVHGLYITAFLGSAEIVPLVVAAVLVVGIAVAVVPKLLASARTHGPLTLTTVALYIGAVSLMAISAAGTGEVIAVVGATLFLTSDILLGWDRFVGPALGGRVLVHITYHFAQLSFVLWLVL